MTRPLIGQAIGSYRLLAKLGEGGMGVVYLAEHTLLRRRAAIKVLLPWLRQSSDTVDRFFAEAQVMATVADPGVVQVFDFGRTADGHAYIVMELLEGEGLDSRLQRLGRLAVIEALRIVRQVATTLAAAHGRGIVHRDLKPENVHLVRDAEAEGGERAKILDFGVAKLIEGQFDDAAPRRRARTRIGTVVGTPLYMSPEQCRGEAVDGRSDVYSLGCLLYHLLCGRALYDDGPGDLVLTRHQTEQPMPPSAVADGIPAMVDEVVLRCLAKNPAERYAGGSDLAAAISGVLVRLTGVDRLAVTVLPMPAIAVSARAPTTRRVRVALAAIAVALAAGVAAAVWLVDGGHAAAASPSAPAAAAMPSPPATE